MYSSTALNVMFSNKSGEKIDAVVTSFEAICNDV